MQAINQGKHQPLVGSYYIAPPDAPVNAATAFMSGFLKTRGPYAQQVFEARLAALDPAQQAAALAAADENAVAALQQQREWEKDQLSYKSDMDKYKTEIFKAEMSSYTDITTSNTRAKTDFDIAKMEQDTKRSEFTQIDPKQMTAAVSGAVSDHDAMVQKFAALKAAGADKVTLDTMAMVVAQKRTKALKEAESSGKFNAGQLQRLDQNMDQTVSAFLAPTRGVNEKGEPMPPDETDARLMATIAAKTRDARVQYQWAAPTDEGLGPGGGRTYRPARPELTGSDVAMTVGRGSSGPSGEAGGPPPGVSFPATGAAPGGSAFPQQFDRVLSGIESSKDRVRELYASPYGGFNDPLPGTEVGLLGGRRRAHGAAAAKAAEEAVAAMQARRAAPARVVQPKPGTSAAADATPAAEAEVAREAAAAQLRAQTMSSRVAADLGDYEPSPAYENETLRLIREQRL